MKNLKKLSREGMKTLNELKNKEIKDLSKLMGARAADWPSATERSEGNCVITDIVYHNNSGQQTFEKDVASVCG
ncbi:MAG TPA: hypothetical protein DIT10_10305 [Chryseobacterium sp.]|jgi:hypothetical protein|uniref:bacteriocin-like protein n=1 Tax=Chryseobacterium lactis TaxID=1241981 RepID=UPI00063D4767|nr:hypothetical protein [Chryseobacterium lactis]HCN49470.1 hypothetical protein [Chryseobacterium sp.]